MISISSLHIYPIKSLGGVSVAKSDLTDRGLKYDRRWMLIDEDNRFISQREISDMALLKVLIKQDGLQVSVRGESDQCFVPFHATIKGNIEVKIWDDICMAQLSSDTINNWFSKVLKAECRLVYMPDSTKRVVDKLYEGMEKINSFSDDFPLTIISESSLTALNERLSAPITMDRFRPNIVITGTYPFEEDEFNTFKINDLNFSVVKPIARCPITTINQFTGEKSKEPLKTLNDFRKKNNKVLFGQNILYDRCGTITIGEQLEFLK